MNKEKIKKNIFEHICDCEFKFLKEEFKFIKVETNIETYGTFLTYKNNTTAIKLSFEPMEAGVYVYIMRLINNDIPDSPIDINSNTELYGFYLEDIIHFKDKNFILKRPPLKEIIKNKVLKQIVAQYAKALKLYASDILNGNFKIFFQLEKIVKKRAKDIS